MMPTKVIVTYIMLELYIVSLIDWLVVAFNAFGNGMTIQEYTHAQDYKYLYEIKRVRKRFDDQVLKNGHKRVTCCQFLTKPFVFLFSCSRQAPVSRR